MDPKALPNLLAGLEVDEAAFVREMAQKPAERSYIIVFTPRSGSSWLTSILSGTKLLGFPEEYANPEFVRDVAQTTNSRDPAGILAILKRRRQTPNGVFGMEVTSTDIELYGESAFFGSFDPSTVAFCLWRDNLIAQGISLYRAVSTHRFHSSDPAASPPAYDADQIGRWIMHIANIENANYRMLERHGYFPRMLRYEDIIRSRATTISIFADAMRVDVPPDQLVPKVEDLRKIGDQWNEVAERTFRKDHREFVWQIAARRLIKGDL